jgi:hypothetical protein
MRHWTEKVIGKTVAAFASDLGMRDFQLNANGIGPDAFAYKGKQLIWFEFKGCKVRVADASQASGDRPGRFRIDPNQHPGRYGTPNLWYVLVVYEGNSKRGRDIVKVSFVRSDKLPQRDTVISLQAMKG